MTTHLARSLSVILLMATTAVTPMLAQADVPKSPTDKSAETLRVAGMFGDRMVLQQQTTVPIWGRAEPNAGVRVAASWRATVAQVVADEHGAWRTRIETPVAGGPFTLTVESGTERRGAEPHNHRNPKVFRNGGKGGPGGGKSMMLPQVEIDGTPTTHERHYVHSKGLHNHSTSEFVNDRIVTGSDGSVYTTSNHYASFTRSR